VLGWDAMAAADPVVATRGLQCRRLCEYRPPDHSATGDCLAFLYREYESWFILRGKRII